jgi:hypothetical protein
MKIIAECVLVDNTEIDISVDLDCVETLSDVFDYVNNEPEVQNNYVNNYVKCIKNEDEIEKALIENIELEKAMDKIHYSNM